MIVNIFFKNI